MKWAYYLLLVVTFLEPAANVVAHSGGIAEVDPYGSMQRPRSNSGCLPALVGFVLGLGVSTAVHNSNKLLSKPGDQTLNTMRSQSVAQAKASASEVIERDDGNAYVLRDSKVYFVGTDKMNQAKANVQPIQIKTAVVDIERTGNILWTLNSDGDLRAYENGKRMSWPVEANVNSMVVVQGSSLLIVRNDGPMRILDSRGLTVDANTRHLTEIRTGAAAQMREISSSSNIRRLHRDSQGNVVGEDLDGHPVVLEEYSGPER